MRTIKFRGISLDSKKWVYGDLVQHRDGHVSICENPARKGFGATEGFYTEVKPETVGQYTGIKDKNVIEIFEKDVVQKKNHMNEMVVGVVSYWGDGWWIRGDNEMIPLHGGSWIGTLEKLGNKHENPELLERSEG